MISVPVFGPAQSRPIVGSHSISMVSDRSLQYVDYSWSAFMVVNWAEYSSGLDSHHTHSKLASLHTLDFRAKVNRFYHLHRNTVRLRCRLFVAHRVLLSVIWRPIADRQTKIHFLTRIYNTERYYSVPVVYHLCLLNHKFAGRVRSGVGNSTKNRAVGPLILLAPSSWFPRAAAVLSCPLGK